MKAVIVLSFISSWQTTSSQNAPNSAWATDSFVHEGNLPTHQQSSRSPAIGLMRDDPEDPVFSKY